MRRQGSQVSMRVARGSASLLSSHGRGIRPQDALKTVARVNVDILGISKLKWTGMGEFNSDDHYIYYCANSLVQNAEHPLPFAIGSDRIQRLTRRCGHGPTDQHSFQPQDTWGRSCQHPEEAMCTKAKAPKP